MPTPPFHVSVIIPAYRAAAYVGRAVASALDQREAVEILLVEDGSRDATLEVCRRLAAVHPGRVRLHQHPGGGNQGPGPSRNLGIRHARCPFIAFLDADDYYLPGRFATDARMLMEDETLDGVYHALGTDILDEAGRRWWTAGPPRPEWTTVATAPSPENLFFELAPVGNGGWFSFDTLTVRRNVFERAAWFSDLRLSQDTLLSLQLAAVCRLAAGQTQQPVAMRGVHAGNRIQDTEALRQAAVEVRRRLLVWGRQRNLPRAQRRAIWRLNLFGQGPRPAPASLVRLDPHLLADRLFYHFLFEGLRRNLCRQTRNDPLLPGVFPKTRQALARRFGA